MRRVSGVTLDSYLGSELPDASDTKKVGSNCPRSSGVYLIENLRRANDTVGTRPTCTYV